MCFVWSYLQHTRFKRQMMFDLESTVAGENAQYSTTHFKCQCGDALFSPVIFLGATRKNHFTVYQAAAFTRALWHLHNLTAGYQKKKEAKKEKSEAPLRSDESGTHSRGAELRLRHNIQVRRQAAAFSAGACSRTPAHTRTNTPPRTPSHLLNRTNARSAICPAAASCRSQSESKLSHSRCPWCLISPPRVGLGSGERQCTAFRCAW